MINKDNTLNNSNLDNQLSNKKLNKKKTVDINILLNRVRADKRKEKIESTIFISIIVLAVISSGLVLSFR